MRKPEAKSLLELRKYIEFLRSDLLAKGTEFGLLHEKTLEASSKLDRYILEYQRILAAGTSVR